MSTKTIIYALQFATLLLGASRALGHDASFYNSVTRFIGTSTSVAAFPAAVLRGTTVTLTSATAGVSMSGVIVSFYVDGNLIGTAPTDGSSRASVTFNTSALAAGQHTVNALFPSVFVQQVTQLNHIETHRVGFTTYYHYFYDVISYYTTTSSGVTLVTIAEPPAIVAHPQSQTVPMGATATLTVAATGTAPLSYQWRFDGAAIAGAMTSTLVLQDVQQANAGTYTVTVSNPYGLDASQEAILTVTPTTNVVAKIVPESLHPDGRFQLQCVCTNWRRFVFETSPNLLNWVPFSSNSIATGAETIVDPEAGSWKLRFYRARAVP